MPESTSIPGKYSLISSHPLFDSIDTIVNLGPIIPIFCLLEILPAYLHFISL